MSSIPTQKDVARAAGVSQSAVSLALRNMDGVSQSERGRIRRIARRLGYRPAVDAQRLAARRAGTSRGGPVLAWINQEAEEDFWSKHPISQAYFRGASQRAGQLGYRIESFWLRSTGPERLARILGNRGMEGVLVPFYEASSLDLAARCWTQFSLVTLNHYPSSRIHDHVRADFQHNVDIAWHELAKEPGLRIGLVLKRIFNEQTDATTLGRFLMHQQTLPPRLGIPHLLVPDISRAKLRALSEWMQRWRPDIILARDYELASAINAIFGIRRRPELVQLQLNAFTLDCRGINEHNEEIGAAAVELICSKLLHPAERAFRGPRELLVKGEWKCAPTGKKYSLKRRKTHEA